MEKAKFKKGDFIQHVKPYDGEGEKLVVDFDYNEEGDFHGYKTARLKGKHTKEADFDNLLIVTVEDAQYYEKVA